MSRRRIARTLATALVSVTLALVVGGLCSCGESDATPMGDVAAAVVGRPTEPFVFVRPSAAADHQSDGGMHARADRRNRPPVADQPEGACHLSNRGAELGVVEGRSRAGVYREGQPCREFRLTIERDTHKIRGDHSLSMVTYFPQKPALKVTACNKRRSGTWEYPA